MIFTLNPIHRMSQTFFIEQNIFAKTFLFMPLPFLCSRLSSAKYEYIFGFNLTDFSKPLICLNYHNLSTFNVTIMKFVY